MYLLMKIQPSSKLCTEISGKLVQVNIRIFLYLAIVSRYFPITWIKKESTQQSLCYPSMFDNIYKRFFRDDLIIVTDKVQFFP